jgi:hypothetical protein
VKRATGVARAALLEQGSVAAEGAFEGVARAYAGARTVRLRVGD